MADLSTFWVSTSTGRAFDFENPRPEMVSLDDIVHHLSREGRWSGNIHFASFSVAQHSLIVASACKLAKSRAYALLHDAPEGYIRDLATPWKLWLAHQGADVVALERRILHQAIYPAFGLRQPTSDIVADVHNADQIALATEFRDVVKGKAENWMPPAPPLRTVIKFMPQAKVEETFRIELVRAIQMAGGRAV